MTNQAKRFPIQGGLTISWEAAERAYQRYKALYGEAQSLAQLARRSGFGLYEFVLLYDGKNPTTIRPFDDRHIAEVLSKADVRSV